MSSTPANTVSPGLDESETSMALLNGLPEAYDSLISALDAIHGEDDTLELDTVKSRVLQEQQRVDHRASQAVAKAESAALLAKRSKKSANRPRCAHCGNMGHVSWENTMPF